MASGFGGQLSLSGVLKSAAISFTGAGDNTIINGVAGKRIFIHSLVIEWPSGSTNVTFKDGSNLISGAMQFGTTGGAITLDPSDLPWLFTSAGNAFIINQSGTSAIAGWCQYRIQDN